LIFKAKSLEEKEQWKTAILSSMLSGYDRKLSESAKSKLIEMEKEKLVLAQKSNNESSLRRGMAGT
jgi:hypothetical protein